MRYCRYAGRSRSVLSLASALLLIGVVACGSDDPTSSTGLDVSGTWLAILDGTVYNNENGDGETTTITLTLTQSGSGVTGLAQYFDTRARQGSKPVSGTLSGNSLSIEFDDFDPQCSPRSGTGTGTVSGTTLGSRLDLYFSAPVTELCPAISSQRMSFTKQ